MAGFEFGANCASPVEEQSKTPLEGNFPGTVILMLAFAWTFTASPVSGQVQQEILHRAERANESIQTRVGSMDDLGRDVPQNDPEDGSWKRILIGAGVGLTVGFVIGWEMDFPGNQIFLVQRGIAVCALSRRYPRSLSGHGQDRSVPHRWKLGRNRGGSGNWLALAIRGRPSRLAPPPAALGS